MAAERIGRARCPLCRTVGASVSLTKKGLTCLTCNSCNSQLFARSGRSDELLRAHIVPDAAPEAVPAPVAVPAPAIPTSTAPKAPAAPPVAVVPATQKKAGFGLLGSW